MIKNQAPEVCCWEDSLVQMKTSARLLNCLSWELKDY